MSLGIGLAVVSLKTNVAVSSLTHSKGRNVTRHLKNRMVWSSIGSLKVIGNGAVW